MKNTENLLNAAEALVKKLKQIHDDPQYKSVWTLAWSHGIDYSNGPKYDKELEALETAIAQTKE